MLWRILCKYVPPLILTIQLGIVNKEDAENLAVNSKPDVSYGIMQAVVYEKKTRVSSGIIKAAVYEENTSLVTNIFRQFKYNTSEENDIRGPWSDGIDSLLN